MSVKASDDGKAIWTGSLGEVRGHEKELARSNLEASSLREIRC
mgnify:CR=1 FL=1